MARQKTWLVGSSADCDVVVPHPNVSANHCRLTRSATGFVLEDLQSSNGTFVNGVRLVSLTIYPSEFVGLMGPSGAGKSTLMNVLNGYTPPRSGEVLINGRSLYQHFDEFRGMIGFVPQDNIIHSELTVREALFYSARLRLPSDFSNRDIHKRIDAVLAQLGLAGIDDVLIGSPTRKGISGGFWNPPNDRRVRRPMRQKQTRPKLLRCRASILRKPTSPRKPTAWESARASWHWEQCSFCWCC